MPKSAIEVFFFKKKSAGCVVLSLLVTEDPSKSESGFFLPKELGVCAEL